MRFENQDELAESIFKDYEEAKKRHEEHMLEAEASLLRLQASVQAMKVKYATL